MKIQGQGKPRQKGYYLLGFQRCAFRNGIWFGFSDALNRMVNRQGVPEEMLSDNGTNFVAANKEMCQLLCEDPRTKAAPHQIRKSSEDLIHPMLKILVA